MVIVNLTVVLKRSGLSVYSLRELKIRIQCFYCIYMSSLYNIGYFSVVKLTSILLYLFSAFYMHPILTFYDRNKNV